MVNEITSNIIEILLSFEEILSKFCNILSELYEIFSKFMIFLILS